MKKEFREGWLAACRLMGTMIDQGMLPAEAISAVEKAAAEDPAPRRGHRPAFAWEEHLEEYYPSLKGAVQALRDYTAYRAEAKLKRWTARTWRSNLKKWQAWGSVALEQQIEESIRNGWQGIFEPRSNRGSGKASGRRKAVEPTEPTRRPHAL